MLDARCLYRVGQEHLYTKRRLTRGSERTQRFLRIFLSSSSGKYAFSQVVCAGAFLFGNELSYGPACVFSVRPSGVPFGNFQLERSGLGRMLKCGAPLVGS